MNITVGRGFTPVTNYAIIPLMNTVVASAEGAWHPNAKCEEVPLGRNP